jgi:hypothetical protein
LGILTRASSIARSSSEIFFESPSEILPRQNGIAKINNGNLIFDDSTWLQGLHADSHSINFPEFEKLDESAETKMQEIPFENRIQTKNPEDVNALIHGSYDHIIGDKIKRFKYNVFIYLSLYKENSLINETASLQCIAHVAKKLNIQYSKLLTEWTLQFLQNNSSHENLKPIFDAIQSAGSEKLIQIKNVKEQKLRVKSQRKELTQANKRQELMEIAGRQEFRLSRFWQHYFILCSVIFSSLIGLSLYYFLTKDTDS